MFALWGDDLATVLHTSELRGTLKAAGATRLQVNVDDAPVSRAMRIASSAEPIGAIVSVWTSGDPTEVVAVLRALPARVAGWAVEERQPIRPPDSPDGERLDALANVALIRRPDELSEQEWLHRWRVDHTPIAIETQASFGYVQNLVLEPVTDQAPPVSALVEELFPTAGIDDLHAFYGSGGDDDELNARLARLMASVTRIGADRGIDLVPTSRSVYDLSR